MQELSSKYNPKEIEGKWYELWAKTSLFHSSVKSGKKPFTIVIPPPNVTGILHMGHALNNTIQDVLIRTKRMQGFEALWMPGTDHAGIATQNVVERKILEEGLKRQDLGREEFVKRVWQWKREHGSTIIHQLKRMGATCDWLRERFTMDENYSKAVIDVFVSLYDEGLIYRGSYIINWCPRCQTALADEEAPHQELDGKLYYIKYPIKELAKKQKSASSNAMTKEAVIVATTRPETMLGDTAVAVNPSDKRYKSFIGKTILLPLVGREIKIIADKKVEKKFGTGAVKVTPAHDPCDYQIGKDHDLEFINIMHPNGVLNDNAKEYAGMERFKAREAVVKDLNERNLLVKIEPHKHAVGHCYRCHTVVEPYLSKQWFVKMKPLSIKAIKAVKRYDIKFYPKRWTKVYLNWMNNIRDWCISRQIWWGHRLPVYYCKDCIKTTEIKSQKLNQKNPGVIVSRTRPSKCPKCGSSDLEQDPDVLDTWFSSWLWPFATFNWPPSSNPQKQNELEYFYPTSALVTAPEIIFFWVARMIMAGFHFMGKPPFRDVYIHGTVRDIEGKKMSKSLGNSIDPLEIINEYGADALRFSLLVTAASGADIYLSKERFQQGRNFANKIWNASRFILMNLEDGPLEVKIKRSELKCEDLWILSSLNHTVKKVTNAVESYRLSEAINTIYDFFWHKFCDWYLEIAKYKIKDDVTQSVLIHVLKNVLLLLHPFMPFITEEVFSKLSTASGETMAIEPWPCEDKSYEDNNSVISMELAFACIFSIRNIRAELDLPARAQLKVKISTGSQKSKLIESAAQHIKNLAGISKLEISTDNRVPGNSLNLLVDKNVHIYLLLEGLVDVNREKEKIDSQILVFTQQLSKKDSMLKNKDFVKRAPKSVVEKERLRLSEFKEAIERLKGVRSAFK